MIKGEREMKTLRGIGWIVGLCAMVLLPSASMAQAFQEAPPVQPPPAEAGTAPAAAQPTGPATGTAPAAAASTDASPTYPLGPQDVIEYNVLGTTDRVRARIDPDGTIQTNLGGRIAAAGRTPRQLALEIAAALKAGGFYADPVVNVDVVGYGSRYVTVLGSFQQPGLIPLNRDFHLSEILARVGGVRADGADYIIVRSDGVPEKRYLVSKLSSGDPASDPLMKPGDKIYAPQAEMFYITGEVKAPGTYPLKSDMTIAQAIARGGGLTDSGSDKTIKVRRGDKIVKLKAEAKVEPGDILTISERLF